DALILDSTSMSIEEVIDKALNYAKKILSIT
ncbi:cytidylate kinase, partial [Enterobacter hormaechei]|nr:cytidylate kinase [Enterobacter hormaechei]